MTRLPTHRPYLVLFLLCLACSDEDPTQPGALDPLLYITPNTDESCGTACLRDDIEGKWTVTSHPSSGTYIVLEGVKDPTTGGSRVEATYCIYRTSDDYLYGCQQPASWFVSYAYRPDRKVLIEGRDLHGITRVRFTGFAPVPEVRLLQYERPAVASCSGSSMIYCYGYYRIQISLRNTGWYGTDRVYMSGKNAAGSYWALSDAGASVSKIDETAQWVWDRVHPGDPGSRIVVAYHPWDANADGRMEFSVPLRDASPNLTLDAIEAPSFAPEPGGPMAIQVEPGTQVIFTPDAPGASLIEVQSWAWTPADTTQQSDTGTCAYGVTPCMAPVFEDGTMTVTARVDGQMRQATAPVGMSRELVVTASPERILAGTMVHFDAAAIGGSATNLSWRWSPDSASGTTAACLAGQESCDVAVQESGWMVATAQVAGVECADSAYVKVVCDFFAAGQDSLLSDPELQYIFAREWGLSAPGDTLNAVERGGYIIERNGRYEFHPFPTWQGASACGFPSHDVDAFRVHEGANGRLVAVFHTHPLTPGWYTNNGLCPEEPLQRFEVHPGSSEDDRTHAVLLGNLEPNVRFFAIERGVVYEFDAFFLDGNTGKALGGTNTPIPRNTTCELY